MPNKKIMMLAIFVVGLLALGAANAADDIASDTEDPIDNAVGVSIDSSDDDSSNDEVSENILKSAQNDDDKILGAEIEGGEAESPNGHAENESLENSLAASESDYIDLAVTSKVNATSGTVNVGDLVEITVTAYNYGPGNATDVYVIDELDSHFDDYTFIATEDTTYDGHTWNIGKLDAGTTATLNISAKVRSDGLILNNAKIYGYGNDTNESNNNANLEINANPVVDLIITKSINVPSDTVYIGDKILFTITVVNNGPCDATNVNVSEALSPQLELVDYYTWDSYYDVDEGIWYIGDLAKDDWRQLVIEARVISPGWITNEVTVICYENDTNKSNNKASIPKITATFEVDLKVNETVDRTNVSVGDEVTYTIAVTNSYLTNATNVNVTWMIGNAEVIRASPSIGQYFNGIWQIGTLKEGISANLTITIRTLAVGTLESSVSVNSTEKDNVTSDNMYSCENVTVNGYPSFVSGENVTATYGETIAVPVTSEGAVNVAYKIVDCDNKIVAEGIVAAGSNITDLFLDTGNYTVMLTTVPDANHTQNSNISSITVNPAGSFVNGENVTVHVGEPITVHVTSENATGITYTIFDKDGGQVDDGTLQVGENITYLELAAGTYTVNLTTITNGNYTSSSATSTITVEKFDLNITVAANDSYVGDRQTVIVDAGADNATGNVTIEVDGKNYTTSLSNGKAEFEVSGLKAGTYMVNAYYTGDENYNPSENTTSFKVKKTATELTGKAITATYNKNKNLVVTLKDDNGNPVSGAKVSVKIKSSKKYTTDENGQIKVSTKGLAPKKYTAKITFAGSDAYGKSSASVKVTVKKATPKMTAKKKTFKKDTKTKKYTITLKNNIGKPIKKAKVTLKVKGKTYKATTNSKGKATFKITKLNKKGTYKAAIKYKGDKYYKKLTKKVKIKVKGFETLSKGSKDKKTVEKLQKALKKNGYYIKYKDRYLKVDGIYHKYTEKAVKEFQKDKGLKVTGKVDEKTAKKLKII